MGQQDSHAASDANRMQEFMMALLADVKALETMIREGMIESDVRRIGAEQEMFLIDSCGRPANRAVEVLKRIGDPGLTHELALFNVEANLAPQVFDGKCLSRMEAELEQRVEQVRTAAREERCEVVLTGILPTLRQDNLGLESMTPNPRYRQLNDAISRVRGEFRFRIKGVDELEIIHDNVMVESCNTSFQVHLQVDPDEFAHLYNLAQLISAPVLAAAVNSPLLHGRRLWHETRCALFQQSVDARTDAEKARGLRPRVSFGTAWVKDSVLEIFREDIARYRIMLASDPDEDPMDVLARGEIPKLKALCMHNGTVYRWNRACYGVGGGKPHLRIENRFLPAGPSILDEMGNAAFFFGLMAELSREFDDVPSLMPFARAQENIMAAARHGLKASFTWLDGSTISAQRLILDDLLPKAEAGLQRRGIDAADIERYLGVVEARVSAGTTGSQWLLDSFNALDGHVNRDQLSRALTLTTLANQKAGKPVHQWELAGVADADDWRYSYLTVGQFMTTDLFTVRPDDIVDLAASLMDWRHIRHVPVEDTSGRLVGLVSHRALLRLVGHHSQKSQGRLTVEEIMRKDPVFVSPDTPTLRAIEVMRENRVGCLPIVEKGRLVGIITERDLITVASVLFERHLKESTAE